ncbi:hypothetical protein ACFQQB_48650 [Nonomuraea rubra]|uniref:hypothetical protein n=1 Tax=Nonomuraea rubra TaxID=46180 RepID=UPI003621F3C3
MMYGPPPPDHPRYPEYPRATSSPPIIVLVSGLAALLGFLLGVLVGFGAGTTTEEPEPRVTVTVEDTPPEETAPPQSSPPPASSPPPRRPSPARPDSLSQARPDSLSQARRGSLSQVRPDRPSRDWGRRHRAPPVPPSISPRSCARWSSAPTSSPARTARPDP